MPINGKNRSPDSMTFNVVDSVELTSEPRNVAESAGVNTVIDALPLSLDTKVVRVSCTAQAVSGVHVGLQIVYGTIAPTSVETIQDANAPLGSTVFAGTVSIAAANAFACVTLGPANINAIYEDGECLTVRAQTDGTTTVTGLRVFADLVRYDGQETRPGSRLRQLGPNDF